MASPRSDRDLTLQLAQEILDHFGPRATPYVDFLKQRAKELSPVVQQPWPFVTGRKPRPCSE